MRFEPASGLSGELRAPADKSISHRAALLGAMAAEPVRIERYLHAADTTSTLDAVRKNGERLLHGVNVTVKTLADLPRNPAGKHRLVIVERD